MRLTCPHCGERDHAEFTYRGDAAPQRPALRQRGRDDALSADAAMIDYVYLRDNTNGVIRELWQHSGGCRAWIKVDRDVTSHAVEGAMPARDVAQREAFR